MLYKNRLLLRAKLKENFDKRIRINNLIKRNDNVLKKDYLFEDTPKYENNGGDSL